MKIVDIEHREKVATRLLQCEKDTEPHFIHCRQHTNLKMCSVKPSIVKRTQ